MWTTTMSTWLVIGSTAIECLGTTQWTRAPMAMPPCTAVLVGLIIGAQRHRHDIHLRVAQLHRHHDTRLRHHGIPRRHLVVGFAQ